MCSYNNNFFYMELEVHLFDQIVFNWSKTQIQRYKYKQKTYSKNIQSAKSKAFSFRVDPSSSRWIRSSAINERNVCTSSTDNETAIIWLIQKVASDPSLAVLI